MHLLDNVRKFKIMDNIEKGIAWYEGKIDETVAYVGKSIANEKLILEAAESIKDYKAKIQGLRFAQKRWE